MAPWLREFIVYSEYKVWFAAPMSCSSQPPTAPVLRDPRC